ncbi:hypothetical protein LS71_008275 [Helicobacter jaachi]|uniref:Uncharacterized protein n=1 Tax=Helicobacter jaachi TaxID=1677920 RepID=A0A4U8T760_9HELI|nr:hypothetical protein [Helicobacter jaachi]TLD95393.1 hypothetical protein LS71_008275 [Helicobacter jaachi]
MLKIFKRAKYGNKRAEYIRGLNASYHSAYFWVNPCGEICQRRKSADLVAEIDTKAFYQVYKVVDLVAR